MNLLLFILCCYGITQILIYGKIFNKIRPNWYLFKCPMCLGFHVGWIVSLLFLIDNKIIFNNIFIGLFLAGGISSGTSYALINLFGDDGINFFNKK